MARNTTTTQYLSGSISLPSAFTLFMRLSSPQTSSTAVAFETHSGSTSVFSLATGEVRFYRAFSTTQGRWSAGSPTWASQNTLAIRHDGTTAAPTVRLNGANRTVTQTQAPSGTVTTTAATAYVLNGNAGTVPWGGTSKYGCDYAIYNRVLSDSEVDSLASGRLIQSGLVYAWRMAGSASPEPPLIGGVDLTVTGATAATDPTTIFTAPPAPGAPTATLSGSDVIVTWTTMADAASYILERAPTSSGTWTPVASGIATNTYTDTPGAGTWYYRIKATNQLGTGSASSASGSVTVPSGGAWHITTATRPLLDRIRRVTIAASAGEGYVSTSKDGSTWSYFAGPLTGSTLAAAASQAAAAAAPVALPTNGYLDLPSITECRFIRLHHRGSGSAYTLYEFFPRRIVQSDDVEAEAIKAIHLAAGAITADTIAAGAIDGKLITGATIQTAASGERIVMNASNLTSYNSSGVAQVTLAGGNGGSLTAGATRLDANGLNFIAQAAWTTGLRWINATGGVIGTMAAYDSNQGRGVQETIDLPAGISGSRMWYVWSGNNSSSIRISQHPTDTVYRSIDLGVGDASGSGSIRLIREYCAITAQNYISLTAPTITFGINTGNGDAVLKPNGNGNSAVVFLHGGIANQWNSTNYVGGGPMVRMGSNASFLTGNLALFAGGTSGSIELLTRDTTRVQVSAPGEVGIGTTATTNRRLQVQGFGTGSTYALMVTNGSGGNLMYVRDDSFLWAAANWVIGSDARSKAHIRDLPDSTALLKQLKPKQYARAANPGRTEYGVLAQDLQAVAPDLVLNAATPDGKELLAVDYTSLFMLGLNALMKLTARVESLETKAGI